MKSIKFWDKDGFDVSTYKWSLAERINKTYNGSGSDNTGLCTYSYNELGFRGDSIYKNGFKIMSIGCSLTEGVAVNNYETWSHQLCKLIPNAVDLNFGFGGRSNDYISRCLLSFYDYVQPDLVLIMYTEPYRKEFYTSDGGIEPFHYNPWGYFSEDVNGKIKHNSLLNLLNIHNDFQNWYKNHLLIKYFLESKKCNWLWNGHFQIPKDYNEFNRFDGNYERPWLDYGVDNIHPGPVHNYQYSLRLFEHIKTNFINYLPNDLTKIKKKII
jgi:hypothetical protein